MNTHKKKTKVMAVGQEEYDLNIQLEEEIIEQVHKFEYLGITVWKQK